MTPTEIDQFLAAAGIEATMIERAAWGIVLGPWTLDDAVDTASEIRARKPFLNPDDFNPDAHPPHWANAWEIARTQYARLGPGGDYGHAAINRAVMGARRELRYEPEERAKWAFKAAYEAATSPIPTPAVPELEGGVVLPMIGRSVGR